MAGRLISLVIPKELLDDIDMLVENGHAKDRADFIIKAIRLAIREELAPLRPCQPDKCDIAKQIGADKCPYRAIMAVCVIP